jgi:CxxC motif-containing protein
MTNKTSLLCITCPKGCTLEVTSEGEDIVSIKPGCKRGHDYAHREMVDPRRMVATTVRVKGGIHPLLPVYTSAPFPKNRINDLLVELRKVEMTAPVKMEEIIIENILGYEINIIASRDLDIQK